jgi:hypothetical protein
LPDMGLINELNAIKARIDALEQDKSAPMEEVNRVMERVDTLVEQAVEKYMQSARRKK